MSPIREVLLCYYKNKQKMSYRDEDIEFAGKILTRRKELDDEVVDAWLQEKGHVELLDELAGIRQKSSGHRYGGDVKTEYRHWQQAIYRSKSRRMALRWSVAASVVLLIGLCVGQMLRDVQNVQEKTALAEDMIQPGTSKAILVTADGRKVALEQDKPVDIRLNERMRVATVGEGIVYEGAGTGQAKEEYNSLSTPIGGEYALTLSDGTKVYLNAASELKYPVEFSQGKRVVDLTGEAYFEVQKDSAHPFIVRVNGADIRVLGTSFNINAYGDDGRMYTTLVSGSIRFSSEKSGWQEVMIPGTQSVMNLKTGEVELREVDIEPYVSWRKGRFVFQSMTLDLLMRQLQRWYDFEVFYQNKELQDYEFRGVISRDMELNKVLSVISATTNVGFNVQGKVVIIIKR